MARPTCGRDRIHQRRSRRCRPPGSAVGHGPWTLFGRAERIETNELLPIAGHHGPTFRVGKVSLGAVRDFEIAQNVKLGLGGLYALNFVPDALEPSYRGDPAGAMAFVRLKID